MTNYAEVGGGEMSVAWNHKDLKEGSEVEGRYVEKKINVGPKKSNMYILEGASQKWAVWGSTVIDAKFESIAIGKMVKIQYQGKKKGKNGNEFKAYAIFQGVDVAGDEGRVYGHLRSKPKEEPVVDLDAEQEIPFNEI